VIRILLVEPMSLLRGALGAALSIEDDLDVVAELARIDETILMAQAVRPDVAVIDINAFAGDAFAVVYELDRALPGCATLMLADVDCLGELPAMLDARVRGFVGKDITPRRLAQYIRQVARGERVIDPTLAVAALSAPRNPLTSREREVLRVAALGLPSAEVAGRLHLAVGTVRNYMSVILRKTGGRSRLEAVRIAEEAGWL
jgi:two-component system response regulator DesR